MHNGLMEFSACRGSRTSLSRANSLSLPKTTLLMTRSDSIKELLTALAKAQGEFVPYSKDNINEVFSTETRIRAYADLASVIAATKTALAGNGLSIMQMPGWDKDDGTYVETLLGHCSGEWIASRLYLYADPRDPHGMGSAISYARRYALQAVLGVAAEDDDGNGAAKRKQDAGKGVSTDKKRETGPERLPQADWKQVTLKEFQEDKVGETIWHWFDFSNNLTAFTSDVELAKQVKAFGEVPRDAKVALVRGKFKLLSVSSEESSQQKALDAQA